MKNLELNNQDREIIVSNLDWEKMDNLIPVIAQDKNTGEVLMQAYANREALNNTLETGNATYWSRSRSEIWEKGLTSGTTQIVYEVLTDCDNDCLIYKIEQLGEPAVACHTGERSCFYTSLATIREDSQKDLGNVLGELYQTLEERKRGLESGTVGINDSYTAKLLNKGVDSILKKIGEEVTELLIGVKNNDEDNIIKESSDVLYFFMVLLIQTGISPVQIANELYSRFGISGIEEKKNRK